MIIWLALVIPLLFAIGLAIFFEKKVVWQEMLLLLIAPSILVAVAKFTTEKIMVGDTEYMGGWTEVARYFEPWNERVPCRHPIYCTTSCGKNCTTTYVCGHYHPYDVDYHPEYWDMVDSNDNVFGISHSRFDELATKFHNKKFVNMHRHYHTINGDAYFTYWDKNNDSMEFTTVTHSYENRVKVSNSVFNFKRVDPKRYSLFNYPLITDTYKQPAVLGDAGPNNKGGIRQIDRLNAAMGRKNKVRFFILLFHDAPIEAGAEQQAYWKNGNKNELIITIGLDKSYRPTWCYVFSWTKEEDLVVSTRNLIMSQQTLDLVSLANMLESSVGNRTIRRDFKEFSYLTVEPPLWVIILTYMVTLLVSSGLSVWIVTNEYDN